MSAHSLLCLKPNLTSSRGTESTHLTWPESQGCSPPQAPSSPHPCLPVVSLPAYAGSLLLLSPALHLVAQLIPAHRSDPGRDGILPGAPSLIRRAGLRGPCTCFPPAGHQPRWPQFPLLVRHPVLTVRSGEAVSVLPSRLFPQSRAQSLFQSRPGAMTDRTDPREMPDRASLGP